MYNEENLDEKTIFNREVITSGKIKYETANEALNSIKMFKTFCNDYLIKMEESVGIPFAGEEIHMINLLVSNDKFVIDNILYPYNETKYKKILDIINSNDIQLKEIKNMQTDEYMSMHVSYDDTIKTLFINNDNFKINCHTGDLSDETINVKIINPIIEIIKTKDANDEKNENLEDKTELEKTF